MWHVEVESDHLAESIHIFIHSQQHLDTYEAEDDAEPVFQVSEVLGDCSEGEIECTQAENREDVGGKHDERITADREYGGDGIDGKCHIGGLNDQKRDEYRRSQALTVLYDEELVFMHLISYGEELLEESDEDVL